MECRKTELVIPMRREQRRDTPQLSLDGAENSKNLKTDATHKTTVERNTDQPGRHVHHKRTTTDVDVATVPFLNG